ncbi:hypothetical protein DB346_25080 [Verrucomicrobia bacterium LW23]|nr:hypothetical protein DB346_25080 [Verrucomicrobia bacterium LW23]
MPLPMPMPKHLRRSSASLRALATLVAVAVALVAACLPGIPAAPARAEGMEEVAFKAPESYEVEVRTIYETERDGKATVDTFQPGGVRIWLSKGNVRMDTPSPVPDDLHPRRVAIFQKTSGKFFVLNPGRKICAECPEPLPVEAEFLAVPLRMVIPGRAGNYIPAGKETVRGIPCEVFTADSVMDKQHTRLWLDVKTQYPVQIEHRTLPGSLEEGAIQITRMEFVFTPGEPKAALFEVPADFREADFDEVGRAERAPAPAPASAQAPAPAPPPGPAATP